MTRSNASTIFACTIVATLVVATVPALAESPNLSGIYVLTETQNCPFQISGSAVVNARTLRQAVGTLEFTPSALGARLDM